MSSAAELCVSQPADIRSTPVAAIALALAAVMRPEASVTARSPVMATERYVDFMCLPVAGSKSRRTELPDLSEISTAFSSFAAQRLKAVLVNTDPYYLGRRDHLAELAASHSLPAIYSLREHVAAGGLISYGANLIEAYRLLGGFAGRILRGGKPAEMPVEQPTKYVLTINLKTARALGLDVPPTLLARADEVIE